MAKWLLNFCFNWLIFLIPGCVCLCRRWLSVTKKNRILIFNWFIDIIIHWWSIKQCDAWKYSNPVFVIMPGVHHLLFKITAPKLLWYKCQIWWMYEKKNVVIQPCHREINSEKKIPFRVPPRSRSPPNHSVTRAHIPPWSAVCPCTLFEMREKNKLIIW